VSAASVEVAALARADDYPAVVARLSALTPAVARFFEDVLVLDARDRNATHYRASLLGHLRSLLTSYFDLTQLAGEATAAS
jgi:glycyl-tRNA synthetase beta subunit